MSKFIFFLFYPNQEEKRKGIFSYLPPGNGILPHLKRENITYFSTNLPSRKVDGDKGKRNDHHQPEPSEGVF